MGATRREADRADRIPVIVLLTGWLAKLYLSESPSGSSKFSAPLTAPVPDAGDPTVGVPAIGTVLPRTTDSTRKLLLAASVT